MNTETEDSCEKKNCPIGGCGSSKGMCPGIALIIAFLTSSLVSHLTSIPKLQLPVTVVIALLLILGFYPSGGRWFPEKSS